MVSYLFPLLYIVVDTLPQLYPLNIIVSVGVGDIWYLVPDLPNQLRAKCLIWTPTASLCSLQSVDLGPSNTLRDSPGWQLRHLVSPFTTSFIQHQLRLRLISDTPSLIPCPIRYDDNVKAYDKRCINNDQEIGQERDSNSDSDSDSDISPYVKFGCVCVCLDWNLWDTPFLYQNNHNIIIDTQGGELISSVFTINKYHPSSRLHLYPLPSTAALRTNIFLILRPMGNTAIWR